MIGSAGVERHLASRYDVQVGRLIEHGVAEFIHGAWPDGRGRTFAVLGTLLGRLHARSGATPQGERSHGPT